MEFELNTDDIMKYGQKLGDLHKSAFPSAVRATLNGAAFDVKQRSLLVSAKQNFVERQPNFFKANSKVDMATGFNVDTMKSTVGMVSLKGNNKAVDDLEQQEHGGTIKARSFIAMKTARSGKNTNRLVQKKNRLSTISNIVNAKKSNGKSEKQRFVKSAIFAGQGGFVLSEKNILWRIDKLIRKDGMTRFKMTPIYNFEKGRSVKVKATHFMETAAVRSSKKMPELFRKEAEFQFSKHLKI
jgi:hypothetical protein